MHAVWWAQPDDVVKELDGLPAVYNDTLNQLGVTDVMILGDLNADCTYLSQVSCGNTWAGVSARVSRVFDVACCGPLRRLHTTTCCWCRILSSHGTSITPSTPLPRTRKSLKAMRTSHPFADSLLEMRDHSSRDCAYDRFIVNTGMNALVSAGMNALSQ